MSSGRKGAKSPRSAMSILLSSGLLNGLSSSVHGTEKATAVSSSKEKKSKVLHSGYLLKLSGKTVLSGGNWKRRFFVLEKRRLVYYESEEVWRSGARASGFVSLEFYDACEEKQTRKATNVFFIGAGDKNLFEPTRHFFSAETLPEMTAWMSHIRSALKEARKSQRVTSKAPPETQKKNEEKRREIEKDSHKKVIELRNPMEIHPEPSLETLMTARPRGPAGKRPPTNHRVTLLREDMRSKSNSLTTLEVNPKEERKAMHLMSRSVDLSDGEDTYQIIQTCDKRLTLYDYSSDENTDSEISHLNESVTSAAALTAKKEARISKSDQPPRQSFGSTPSLILECEDALKHSPTRHYNTAPTSARKARRAKENKHMPLSDSRVTDTLNDLEQLWSDESGSRQSNHLPSGSSKLMNVLHYLHFQTLEIRKNLLALEEDSADSRRDMGALQENLMMVRTATNNTSDRINRLQNTLSVVEKQIGVATKEAQVLEQRAIRALESAEMAEKEFSRLRNECQSLILQMKVSRNSDRERREDSPVFDTLPDTPSGSKKESFILSSSPSFIPEAKSSKPFADVQATPSFNFDAPVVFEFGKSAFMPFNPSDLHFCSKSSSLSSAATSTPRVQSPVPSKSALRQEKENPANKSVTFEDEGDPETTENV